MWNIVSKFVNDFGSSTTEVGKYWITMFNVLRLMFLFSIAGNAWGGEKLECDTKAPGCSKLCTNEFFSIFTNCALETANAWRLTSNYYFCFILGMEIGED